MALSELSTCKWQLSVGWKNIWATVKCRHSINGHFTFHFIYLWWKIHTRTHAANCKLIWPYALVDTFIIMPFKCAQVRIWAAERVGPPEQWLRVGGRVAGALCLPVVLASRSLTQNNSQAPKHRSTENKRGSQVAATTTTHIKTTINFINFN